MRDDDRIQFCGGHGEVVPVALSKLPWPLKQATLEQYLRGAVFHEVATSGDGVCRAKERDLWAVGRGHGLEESPHVLSLLAIAQAIVEAARATGGDGQLRGANFLTFCFDSAHERRSDARDSRVLFHHNLL